MQQESEEKLGDTLQLRFVSTVIHPQWAAAVYLRFSEETMTKTIGQYQRGYHGMSL